MKKTLLLFLGLLLPLLSFAQNPGFENGFANWSASTSPWTITVVAAELRSGTKAAKLATNSTIAITNQATVGLSATVPTTGTNYVTVIAYVRVGPNNSTDARLGLGVTNGGTPIPDTETIGVGTGFTRFVSTSLAANGTTYQPVLSGRSATGVAVELFYDDVIIYTSTGAAADVTPPTLATRINATITGTNLVLAWTAGTDADSGIDGTLIVRSTALTNSAANPISQTYYSTTSTVGPTAVGTHSVLANGSATGTFTESITNNTVYTYVIFMRDKAYNYSPVARILVFNGTGLAFSFGTNSTLAGLYMPAGNTLTTQSSSTLTLQASTINIGGTIVNQGNLNNSGSVLTFQSGSIYNYNRNNGLPPNNFSLPSAIWAPGSLCRVTGVTTIGPGATGQQFANFEWSSTAQTAAVTLSPNFGATGTVTVASTGTGSLRFPAAGNHSFGGNVTQTGGTVDFEPGNTVAMNGTSAQSLVVNGPLRNLTINNTAGVSLGRSATVATGLLLTQGAFTLNPQTLTMGDGATITRNAGRLSGAPAFTNKVNVTYTAAVTTGPELPTVTDVLQTLTVNTPGTVTLAQATTANTALNFTLGSLLLTNNNLTIGDAASITGASASQFVVTNGTGLLTQRNLGPAGRSGAISFPIGSNVTSYTPATLTNVGTTDAYSVRVYPNVFNNYDATGNATGGALTEHVVDRTWAITEATAGGSDLTAELTWNGTNEIGGFDRPNSFVSNFSNGKWNGDGSTAATGSNPYTQVRNNLTNLGAFGVGDLNSALPVTMLSFTAKARPDGGVQLDWATSAELNNDYFAVERSGDAAKHFQEIARIDGRGTTGNPINYTYLDQLATGSEYYYRLRQVDYDGSFSHSPLVRVVRGDANLFRILSQVGDQLTLATENTAPAKLRLLTLDGRTVQTISAPTAGTYSLRLPTTGVYLLEVRTGQDRQVMKVIRN